MKPDLKAGVAVAFFLASFPLHAGFIEGYQDIYKMALTKGADIKAKDEVGANLLHAAVGGGNLEITKFAIEQGLDVGQADNEGVAPLHLAADMGHADLVNRLLDKGADVNAKLAGNGETPLLTAVKSNNKSAVEILIKRGANINLPDKKMGTPLHAAVDGGEYDLVKLLVDNGANVNAESKFENEDGAISGWTPLAVALTKQSEKEDLLAYLLNKGASTKTQATFSMREMSEEWRMDLTLPPICLLMFNIKGWKTPAVSLLITHGADAKAPLRSKSYFTDALFLETEMAPLHFAAAYGNSAVVESLIKHGAEVNKKSINVLHKNKIPMGKMAEFKTQMAGSGELKLFFDEQNGWTPLHFAAAAGNRETVMALLAHGANAALRDANSKQAVDYVTSDNLEIAILLAQPKSASSGVTQ